MVSDRTDNNEIFANEGVSVVEGVTVFGRYRLLEKIGKGAMASVYLAELEGEDGFRRRVALKLIHSHIVREDASFLEWFKGEARLGGFLDHSNIVPTLDFGQQNGRPFLAMEYIDGPTLLAILALYRASGTLLPLDVALRIVVDICHGLDYAHRAKDFDGRPLLIVHRDLKPSNVLLTRAGNVKIADFGVARSEANELRTAVSGLIKGTLRYLSPEQAQGKRSMDSRSDLFTVAVLAFELFTNEPLYNQKSNYGVLRAAGEADVSARLTWLSGALPERAPVLPWLKRTLAYTPASRFQSGAEMAEKLERLAVVPATGTRMAAWLESLAPGLQGIEPQAVPTPMNEDVPCSRDNAEAGDLSLRQKVRSTKSQRSSCKTHETDKLAKNGAPVRQAGTPVDSCPATLEGNRPALVSKLAETEARAPRADIRTTDPIAGAKHAAPSPRRPSPASLEHSRASFENETVNLRAKAVSSHGPTGAATQSEQQGRPHPDTIESAGPLEPKVTQLEPHGLPPDGATGRAGPKEGSDFRSPAEETTAELSTNGISNSQIILLVRIVAACLVPAAIALMLAFPKLTLLVDPAEASISYDGGPPRRIGKSIRYNYFTAHEITFSHPAYKSETIPLEPRERVSTLRVKLVPLADLVVYIPPSFRLWVNGTAWEGRIPAVLSAIMPDTPIKLEIQQGTGAVSVTEVVLEPGELREIRLP